MVYDVLRDMSGAGLVVGLSAQFAGYVSGDLAIADAGRITALVSGLSYLALLEPHRQTRSIDDAHAKTTTMSYAIDDRDFSDRLEHRLEGYQ